MEDELRHKISNKLMLCYAHLEDCDYNQLRTEIESLMQLWKVYCNIETTRDDIVIGGKDV